MNNDDSFISSILGEYEGPKGGREATPAAAEPSSLPSFYFKDAQPFATLEPEIASEQLAIVATTYDASSHQFVLEAADRGYLRSFMRAFVDRLRQEDGPARTELMSASARDLSVDTLVHQLLARFNATASKTLSTVLPTGMQVVMIPMNVLDAIGAGPLIKLTHREAVLQAAKAGHPYNKRAWSMYTNEMMPRP